MSADPISVWSGLIGTSVMPAVSNAGGTPVRKVRDGILVSPPLSRQDGQRKKHYLLFIGQLNAALYERARTVEWLHEEQGIPLSLQALVCEFHKDVIQAVQKTVGRSRAGAPTTLADARKLISKVRDFELKLDLELTHEHIRAFELALCMRDLCDDVRHYTRQIELTAGIVFLRAKKPLISNRPTNWAAKNELAALVSNFKNARGEDVWPTGAAMRAALKRRGHVCSERTVRSWIQQLKSGSAGFFVQPTTRRQ
jgi:hypothetical protein